MTITTARPELVAADYQLRLLEETRRASTLGYRFAMCQITSRYDAEGKLEKAPAMLPKGGWHLEDQIDDNAVRQQIQGGCNAYLIHCKSSGVTLHDGDSPEEIAQIQRLYPGLPAHTITLKGEHYYTAGYVKGADGKGHHMAYGPGSFYFLPTGAIQVYEGALPDKSTLPVTIGPAEAPKPSQGRQRIERRDWRRKVDSYSEGLAKRLKDMAAQEWGEAARDGLLSTTTYLAKLANAIPDVDDQRQRLAWGLYNDAFMLAGLEPDGHDQDYLTSALERNEGDIIVPDGTLPPSEKFGAFVPTFMTAPGVSAVAPDADRQFHLEQELTRQRARREATRILDAEERGPAHDIQALTFGELAAIPPPVPLIDGLLDRATIALMPGPFGTYKTFVAWAWAWALATGTSWGHFQVPAAVPVVFVAAEGAAGVRKRLSALSEFHGRPVPDTLKVIPRVVSLGDDATVEKLAKAVADHGAGLVITDTLHQCTPGLDEDSNRDMGAVYGRMRRLVIEDTGATWLPLHHTGHAGERSRGASCLEDDADTVILMTLKSPGGSRGADNERRMTLRKAKEREAGAVTPMEVRHVPGAGSLIVTPRLPNKGGLTPFGTENQDALRKQVLITALRQSSKARTDMSNRTLLTHLRQDLGHKGGDEVMNAAIYQYKRDAGEPVADDV